MRGRRLTALVLTAGALGLAGLRPVAADEVRFLNGDRLTGRILSMADGKLVIRTEAAGDVVVKLSQVQTFSTDEPVTVRVGDKTLLQSRVDAGSPGTIQVAPTPAATPQPIALADITQINPPPVRWTGTVSANALFTTGNTETENAGVSVEASRRAEHDRISLESAYLFGRQRDPDTGRKITTQDSVFGTGKYDYFFTTRFFGFLKVRVERDRIADLDLRFTPSIGVGYQWFESEAFNLSTEAGVAWIYEQFRGQDAEDRFAARLAYAVDWKPHERIKLFHDLQWLPAFTSPFGEFLVNANAGLRTDVWASLFTEAKVELRHNSRPTPGLESTDVRYLLSLGWAF